MQLLHLLILILAMVAVAAMSLSLVSRPRAGAILVIVVYLYDALWVVEPPIPLGVQIYPFDIVFFLLLVASLFRYALGMAKPKGLRLVVICLFLLYSIGLARGIAAYGLKQAGNESRAYFDFFAGVLYFSSFTFGAKMRIKVVSAWMVGSMVLAGLVLFRWAATFGGFGISGAWQIYQEDHPLRVVDANSADFLGIAFFASIFLNVSKTGPAWQRKVFYLLGPIILLLQHRTVWGVMLGGFLWLGLRDRQFRNKAIGAVVGMVIAGIPLVALLLRHQVGVGASLKDSATNEGTFLWRVAGWYELLFDNPARSALNDIIGQPFGTGFARVILGGNVDVQPHNFYVETFLRLGIVGLFLLIWLYVSGMRRMKRMPIELQKYAYPGARFWEVVLFLQLIYFFAYGVNYDQSILTGIAISRLGLRLRRPAPPQIESPETPCAPG